MLLDEFIDLVSSFDDNEEVKTVNLNNNTTYDNEGGCIIM
jgi:hypothetical protein